VPLRYRVHGGTPWPGTVEPTGWTFHAVMLSRLAMSAAVSLNLLSPTSALCHWPWKSTATKVYSASPGQDVEMVSLDGPVLTSDAAVDPVVDPAVEVGEGAAEGPPPGAAGCPSLPPCWSSGPPSFLPPLNWCSQQLYASPVAVFSSLFSSPDSALSAAR